MFTKERPHQARGVNAVACGPDPPFRQRLAAGPGMAFSLNGVEQHGSVVGAVRVCATGYIRRHRRINGVRLAPVSSCPIRDPGGNVRKLYVWRVPIRRDMGNPIAGVLKSRVWLEEWAADKFRRYLR